MEWKFRHEGNCSASRGLPSDTEQLFRVMEFSIRTEQPLLILFLAYSSFDNAFRLEYVLFYQFYAKITTFFRSRNVRFGSSLIRWCRNVWWKLTWKWRQDVKKWRQNVKIVILTSCTRVVLHPSCKTTFPSPDRVYGNSGRVCKKIIFFPFLSEYYHKITQVSHEILSAMRKLKGHVEELACFACFHSIWFQTSPEFLSIYFGSECLDISNVYLWLLNTAS